MASAKRLVNRLCSCGHRRSTHHLATRICERMDCACQNYYPQSPKRKPRAPRAPLLPNERASRKLASARRGLARSKRKLASAQRAVDRWERKVRFYDRPEHWDRRTIAAQMRKALGVIQSAPRIIDIDKE